MRLGRDNQKGKTWPVGGIAALLVAALAAPRPSAAQEGLFAGIDSFTAAQADALVTDIFQRKDTARYAEAASAYLVLLDRFDEDPQDAGRERRARHLIPLSLIVPPENRSPMGLDDIDRVVRNGLPDGAGERLVRWWRKQDPLPATPENERVIEHLERIAYAHKHYGERTDPAGFDDRGRIHVRLGPPDRTRSVSFNEIALMHTVTTTGSSLRYHASTRMPSFREAEFWVYRHVHAEAQYLFLEEPRRGFRLGEPQDVVPPEIRSNVRSDQNRAIIYARVLDELYTQLALLAPETYNPRMSLIEMGNVPLESFAFRARAEDHRASMRRDEVVPVSYSNVLDEVEPLPVDVRWARFLDDDGTTRTEVYWSIDPADLEPSRRMRRRLEKEGHEPANVYVLAFHAVQESAGYERRAAHGEEVPLSGEAAAPVRSFTLRGDTALYHVALQWDAYWREPDGTLGSKLNVSTRRADSLRALSADPAVLEMSDLKPLRAESAAEAGIAAPYVGQTVSPAVPLGIYFEVYHLAFGQDGRTRYTVALELHRRDASGRLSRLLSGDRSNRSTSSTILTGADRTARETLLVDLSEWDRQGDLDITVTVTDAVTGQTVERTLTFGVPEG